MVDNNNNNIGASGAANHDEDGAMMKEQEQLLPIANVGRIMKQILPPNAKISKEAKETMQECVSEFISFVTSEASEKCRKERRKTVNGDDVAWALGALGFEDYTGPLRRFLHRYREQEGERISSSAANNNNNNNNNNNENNQDKDNNNPEDQQQRKLLNHPHIQRPNFYKGSSTTGL